MKRKKNIDWEYNYDGRFKYERISKFFKRYWRKWIKRYNKKIIEKEEGIKIK